MTPKRYKGWQLLGGVLLVAGVGLWVWGFRLRQDELYNLRYDEGPWLQLKGAGIGCFLAGTVSYLGARLAEWWAE